MSEFPAINLELHTPLMCDPPMCTLKELGDGTYSYIDLLLMHDIIEFREYLKQPNQGAES